MKELTSEQGEVEQQNIDYLLVAIFKVNER